MRARPAAAQRLEEDRLAIQHYQTLSACGDESVSAEELVSALLAAQKAHKHLHPEKPVR